MIALMLVYLLSLNNKLKIAFMIIWLHLRYLNANAVHQKSTYPLHEIIKATNVKTISTSLQDNTMEIQPSAVG